jgi:argininosuccinate lyase
MDEAMVPLNRSLTVDFRLWPEDIQGSVAWAQALGEAGVLTPEETSILVEGLDRVGVTLTGGDFSQAPDEDVHSLIERLLHEEVGPVAGKLHTGRSRNDQVATDFRLWTMGAMKDIRHLLEDVLGSVLDLAERSVDVILPGYTHLQQAQPIRGAHWALSHFWPLLRDRGRMGSVAEEAARLPLGAGALAGCPFPVDREWLREALGFKSIYENSLDAVSDRDWAAELAFSGALLAVHLSRLSEDLVIMSTQEFGFLSIPEGFCTGSSLMPQKRNPDAAELVRGKTGRLVGNLVGILTLLKGLPMGYNRDLQEDKEAIFDTVDTLRVVLPAVGRAIHGIEFDESAIQGRMESGLLATDIADYLVRKGVPFRESHEVIGTLVRLSEEEGKGLPDLPLSVYRGVHPEFEEDVYDLFSFSASVETRAVRGGTSAEAVRFQLKVARDALSS